VRLIKTQPRFFISLTSAILVFLLMTFMSTASCTLLEHILIGYNAFQWVYVFTLLVLIFKSRPEKIRALAKAQDENTYFLLTTAVIASIISLIGIAFELSTAKEAHGALKILHLTLPAITLVGVWILLPTLFSIHYAHLFYQENSEEHRPIKFPDNPKQPDYFDFLYFSITISVACQTADVSINNSEGRKLVLTQSILAFIFNTSVLALGINVAASLLN